jgi:NIPSNAP
MNRRDFLTSSIAATGVAGLHMDTGMAQTQPAETEYYELRRYHLRVGPMVQRMNEYLKDVSIPALNRAGAKPIGAFTVQFGVESPAIYLLLTHRSIQDFATLSTRLRGDQEFQKASAPHADLPASDPAYVRIDSQLMAAVPFMTKIEVPAGAAGNKPRLFELRTYESHSLKARRMKLEMFGPLGELAIFRRTGLTPVFFGENIVGDRLPSFTYMLVYDDMAAREKAWAAFIDDPEWKTLRARPGFTDAEIVSNISSIVLRPAAYSQI